MRKFNVPPKSVDRSPGVSRGEKTKLALMVLGLLFVVIAFVASQVTSKRFAEEEHDDLPRTTALPPIEEKIALPNIDPAALDALVKDARPEERVVLDAAAVDLVAGWARVMGERHFEELGVKELDAAMREELLANPSAHRAESLRAYAGIDWKRRLRVGTGKQDGWLLRLVLEDESYAYALALELPEGYDQVGAFLRFDGLFLQAFEDEAESGWIEGPLIVSPHPKPSYPAFGPIEGLSDSLENVDDDGIDGTSPLPFYPYWNSMAWARDSAGQSIDWSTVPQVDKVMLKRLIDAGDDFRGAPMRIPVSKLQGVTVKSVGENPARIEEITEGWIGNTTWGNVLWFEAPFADRDLHLRDLVEARGIFFKNRAYEPLKGGLRTAPFFILTSIDVYEPPIDRTAQVIVTIVAIATVFLIGLFVLLLMRDKRQSQQLHEELVRRRRARRERTPADASGT